MEEKVRTFFAAMICAFTILGISSCALFPLGAANTSQKGNTSRIPVAVESAKEAAKVPEQQIAAVAVEDTAVLNHSFNAVWLASQKAIKQMGLITRQEMAKGHIQAKLRGTRVDVTILKTGPKSARLSITAIKDSVNDAQLSAELFDKIQDLANLF